MKNKQLHMGLAGAGAMVVLILDGKTALLGAREGIVLCLMTVIPSLFPFFLLSRAVTSALMGGKAPFLRPLAALLGLPRGAEALAVSTLLGGYPAGAQAVAEGYRAGGLSKKQAEKLLPLCNQPGPAFLFGMVGLLFPKRWMAWALWAVVFLSCGLVSLLLAPGELTSPWVSSSDFSLAAQLRGSLGAMGAVCGWVVLFRVLLAFCRRWWLWLLPGDVQVGVMGLLELSNGCVGLGEVTDLRLRFCLAAGMLSFGGLCVALQTQSVAQGLSLKPYLLGKALQMGIALALSLCVAYGIWVPMVGIFLVFLVVRQKRCGNPRVTGV